MDNKVFGLTFLAILSSALLLFGVANAGSYAVDRWLFPTQTFGENTYIGTTDVSEMDVTEAQALFRGHVESWRQSSELLVTYQDATADYPLDNAKISVEQTVQQAEDGAQNGFVFELSETTTSTFLEQQFPVNDFTNDQVAAITAELEQALSDGQQQTRVTISDDAAMLNRETVAQAGFTHNLESPGIADVVAGLDGHQIEAGAQFSFLDFLMELSYGTVTDRELTEVASAIYGAVLQTNFLVDERSIGKEVPATVPLGQEAAINRPLGVDFVFTNTNDSSFALNMDLTGDVLTASFTGYPFVYSYAISNGPEETVEPRLIKQFSAFVSYGSVVEEPGSDGVRVETLRTITSENIEIETETVSTDFYPPVHRVEVFPLAAAPSDSATEDGDTTGTDGSSDPNDDSTDSDGNENGDTDTDGTDSTDSDSDGSDQDGADSNSGTGTGSGNDGDTDSNNNRNEGTNNNGNTGTNSGKDAGSDDTDYKVKSGQPQYDKGGSLINP
ncbi:VanW family protein [Planococcus salinus]|uniref:G5 domain-containing protein n=1 Tax=Planococcus salinus TaxID=1848460 RepID=A0A3M8PCW0_9BACL|nr:VanW family protein [Planococcus salinus]RNF40930.1 hypothetical protein EEX84_00825 [Planococcus salinus]